MVAPRDILRIKQGAWLALDLFVTDDLGSGVDLTGATVDVVVCDPLGNAVAMLALTPSPEQGWGTIASSTAGWPLGRLNAEVWVTVGGSTEISDTFSIRIERPVSQ